MVVAIGFGRFSKTLHLGIGQIFAWADIRFLAAPASQLFVLRCAKAHVSRRFWPCFAGGSRGDCSKNVSLRTAKRKKNGRIRRLAWKDYEGIGSINVRGGR
jgi:hypothetical protein